MCMPPWMIGCSIPKSSVMRVCMVMFSGRTAAPWSSEKLRSGGDPLVEDLFLHLAQPILAEEKFVADQEGGRTEGAFLEGALGIGQELRLHRVGLGELEDLI